MLILSRKPGERIVIADNIVVTVTEVARGRVRLGIEAPPSVRVVREELRPHAAAPHPTATAVGAEN